jgi:hypothetical protein
MTKPDFSGIDPLRVPEARRRIAAIEQYLALPSPTTADAAEHAARVDLSRWQFLRLVRVWRDHRDAHLLVIGKRGKATRQYGVDTRATDIMEEVVGVTGGAADLAMVAVEVEKRCAVEGIAPPARGTIYNKIREARATSGGHVDGPPRIVVGRMWFHLPVAGQPVTAMPTLLVATLLPERLIVAHQLSTDLMSPPSVKALVEDLLSVREPGAPARQLLIEPDDRRAAAVALEGAGVHVRSHYRSVQREISRAFGGRLGGLKAIYRRGLARPKTKKVLSRQDEPITHAEARDVVETAIAANNERSTKRNGPFDIANR